MVNSSSLQQCCPVGLSIQSIALFGSVTLSATHRQDSLALQIRVPRTCTQILAEGIVTSDGRIALSFIPNYNLNESIRAQWRGKFIYESFNKIVTDLVAKLSSQPPVTLLMDAKCCPSVVVPSKKSDKIDVRTISNHAH